MLIKSISTSDWYIKDKYIYIYIYIYMLCSINDKQENILVKDVYFLPNMLCYIT